MSETNFTYFDRFLNESLPTECHEKLKSFYACKISHNQGLLEQNDEEFMKKYLLKPSSRTEGCQDSWDSFHLCREQFLQRFVLLNNYAITKGEKTLLGKLVQTKDLNIENYNNLTFNKLEINKF